MPFSHPLWLAGFRPFFALAIISGATLPLFWALSFTGAVAPGAGLPVAPLQWHAHEMFYGFGWAMLGGFLLTATKNWVSVRGWHGGALAFLGAAWLIERLAMSFGTALPPAVLVVLQFLFPVALIVMLLHTLLANRDRDDYRTDNLYFIVALPLFLPAKWLLLAPEHFAAGQVMALALFRLAFLLMLERTVTQFMRVAAKTNLPRWPLLDHAIKSLALVAVFTPWLAGGVAAVIESCLAALLLARWLTWRPDVALRRIDIGIMYLGYLAIVGQLGVDALSRVKDIVWVGTVSVHLFTLGAMGLIVPAMIVRIAKGHTGRKAGFTALDKAVLWLMLAALAVRVLLPQWLPERYPMFIHLTATLWLIAFAVLGWRFIPWLLQARVDGKTH